MVNRRVFGVAIAAAVVLSVGLFAQEKQEKRKLDDTQKKELPVANKIVDDILAGQPMPNDLGLTWARADFLKAQGNKEFTPFIVTIDPSKVPSGNVVIYWRVVNAAGAAPAEPAAKDDKNKDQKADASKKTYVWEDISSTVPVTKGTEPMRLSRSFASGAGTYDVYVVVKEPTPKDKKQTPKVAVVKQTLTVPDYWNDELNTSTVILAQKMDPIAEQLKPEQQIERPYALGTMEVVPALEARFKKSQELSVFMLIYNPKTDSANKPDVMLEYNFYQKTGDTEKFFNKTSPQSLNAQTLPPQFDLAAGHQLPGSLAVPLASFPEGDYRLEVKVTDKLANKSITRDVKFTVTGA